MGEPTAPRDPWAALRDAAADRRSGSASVAADAASALERIAADAGGRAELAGRIEKATGVLVRGQPAMAACLRLADDVLAALSSGAAAVADAARDFARHLEREREGLVAALRSFIPTTGTVLTVSASSTVIAALAEATPDETRVLCARSDPGGEGRSTTAALIDAGVSAETIPDAAVASAAASADLVVFGADAVGPSHLLNKVGTLAAALGADHGRRLCIAACGSTKFCGREAWNRLATITTARTASGEGTAPAAVFEPVPLDLLFRVLTEDGPLTPAATRKLATRSRLDARILEILDEVAR